MRNRISNYLLPTGPRFQSVSHQRPTLKLGETKSITVDMERFFDFSFSFAEALIDLEDKFCPGDWQTQQDLGLRENVIQNKPDPNADFDCDFEIDARWM